MVMVVTTQSDKLLDLFPLSEPMRPKQREVLTELQQILVDDSIKYIILEAPTGFGKSAVAITLARFLGSSYICTGTKELQEQYCKDFSFLRKILGSSNFECLADDKVQCNEGPCRMPESREAGSDKLETKTDSEYKCQYKPTMEQYTLVDGGKINYEKCKLSALGKPVWNNHETCDHVDPPCIYYHQKYQGLVSNHTVLNYSYLLALALHTDEIEQRKLLILDEAHTIEEKMIEHSKVRFTKRGLERLIPRFQFPSISIESEFDIEIWLSILERLASDVDILLQISNQARQLKKDNFMLTVADVAFTFDDILGKMQLIDKATMSDYRAGIYDLIHDNKTEARLLFLDKAWDDAFNLRAKLENIITELHNNPSNWVVQNVFRDARNNNQVGLVDLTPLDISKNLAEIFEKGERVLFMSATILSKANFCKTVGLNENEVKFIRIKESDFPIKNRPIYTLDIATLNFRTMNSELPRIAKTVDELMNLHSNEKGIIHLTKYEHLQYIRDNISQKNRDRLLATTKAGVNYEFFGDKMTREELLRRHAESRLPTVIISPSMQMGIDLKDDLSRFQIIVKIPYLDMKDKWVSRKMSVSPSWYSWQAILRLAQAYGRSVRSKDDYATTYILDQGIHSLLSRESSMFPEWFKESLFSRTQFQQSHS